MDGNFEVQVRQRAYELWVTEGKVQGRDRDHWLAAESELARQQQQAAADVQAAKLPVLSPAKTPAKVQKGKGRARSRS